ncbi:CPBP family intramembrane glutamic endopeptidase [uncultured Clostridium sp.]|uniref:CPBP family intramembrane glutamic endopeptidase n=1 Tax=uncultured Clostridium sp. TaxID=59620 RepID=UPI00261F8DDB|nr:CPBP family intramembrane glutamic endopeptidase [uncultured Clostridium sp.]
MFKHYIKGFVFAALCIFGFWVLQFIGGFLAALPLGYGILKFKLNILQKPTPITPAIANRAGILTFFGDIFIFIVILLIIKFIFKKSLQNDIKIKPFKLNKLAVLIPAALGSLMLASIWGSFFVQLIAKNDKSIQMIHALFSEMHSPLAILATILIAPITEELVFRGVLFNYLRRRIPFWPAVIISSVSFGILHGNISQGVFAALLGIILALMYAYTDSLIGDILVHILCNTTSTLLGFIIASNSINSSIKAEFSLLISLTYLLLGPVLVLLALNIYRKRNGSTKTIFKPLSIILFSTFIVFALIGTIGIVSTSFKVSPSHTTIKVSS